MLDIIVKIAQIVAAGVAVMYLYFKKKSQRTLCSKCKNLFEENSKMDIMFGTAAWRYNCIRRGKFDYTPKYCALFEEREKKDEEV